MSLHIAFGQYLPGTTPVHKVDARVKFIIALAATYATFACHTWWAMLALSVIMVVLYAVSKVPFKLALRGLRPLLYILIFTVVVNAFTFSAADGYSSDGLVAWQILGGFAFKPQGLLNGAFFALRIAILVMATSLSPLPRAL